MVILGDSGILNQFLLNAGIIDSPIKIMYTETAVMIGMAQLVLPYMILSIPGVIQNIDPNVRKCREEPRSKSGSDIL